MAGLDELSEDVGGTAVALLYEARINSVNRRWIDRRGGEKEATLRTKLTPMYAEQWF